MRKFKVTFKNVGGVGTGTDGIIQTKTVEATNWAETGPFTIFWLGNDVKTWAVKTERVVSIEAEGQTSG